MKVRTLKLFLKDACFKFTRGKNCSTTKSEHKKFIMSMRSTSLSDLIDTSASKLCTSRIYCPLHLYSVVHHIGLRFEKQIVRVSAFVADGLLERLSRVIGVLAA